jgi:CRP-like cAMP-binding protein
MADDFLNVKRQEIARRMQELEPLVEEYRRLEAAIAALDAIGAPPRRAARRTSAPAASGRRRGRPRGSGTRRAEALAIVTANPGITVAEVAEKLGINQNYLYRVLPALAKDGLIVKSGRGWRATGAA